jgi:hypothetical protein
MSDHQHAACKANAMSPLNEAIATVKAAGLKVSKPRIKHKSTRVGPTCVVAFSDGETVRMTTYTPYDSLDWARGERLAQAAYVTRWRARRRPPYSRATMQWWMGTDWKQKAAWTSAGSIYETDLIEPVLPVIVSMHFETPNGTVLGRRPDREQSNA